MTRRGDRPRRRAAHPVVPLLALAACLFIALPAPAARAHASLVGTDPADGAVLEEAPSVITLSFNEAVQPVDDAIRLVDSDGRDHEVTATARDHDVIIEVGSAPGEGGYALNWRVVSADSHPISGVLAFTVGSESPAAPRPVAPESGGASDRVAAMVAGTAHYLGLLVFTGLLFFKTVSARGPRPRHPRHRLLRASAVVAIAGAAAAVPIGALDAAGLGPGRILDYDAWRTAVQAEALAILGLTAVGTGAAYTAFTRGSRRWTAAVALGAGAAATAAPALAGHSKLYGPAWLMLGADLAHLLTAAIWTGGLIGLLVLLRRTAPRDDAVGPATVVARFSAWAGSTVALLGASGLTMAVLIHRTWGSLLGSDHGRLLLVKLGVVALALALAGWNRFRLVPAVRGAGDARSGLLRLRRILSAEAAAVALAIVVTGVLVHLSPDQAESGPDRAAVVVERELGDGEVSGTLEPGAPGTNTFTFDLTDAEGRPMEPFEDPVVTAFLPEEDFGPVTVPALPGPGGGYRAELVLPFPGSWELEVRVRVSRYEEHRATFTAGLR